MAGQLTGHQPPLGRHRPDALPGSSPTASGAFPSFGDPRKVSPSGPPMSAPAYSEIGYAVSRPFYTAVISGMPSPLPRACFPRARAADYIERGRARITAGVTPRTSARQPRSHDKSDVWHTVCDKPLPDRARR